MRKYRAALLWALTCCVLALTGCPDDNGEPNDATTDTLAATIVDTRDDAGDTDDSSDTPTDLADAAEVGIDLCANVSCPTSPTSCAVNVCNPATGSCGANNAAAAEPCDRDADVCTIDLCDGNGFCVFDSFDLARVACDPPCTTDLECDDGNPCTQDTCSPAVGCSSVPIKCGATCGPVTEVLGCEDVAVAVTAVENFMFDYTGCIGNNGTPDMPQMPGSEAVYEFTAANDGLLKITVDATPIEYAHLALLTDTCETDTCAPWNVLNDSDGEVVVNVTAGTTYFIVIDSAVGGVLSVESVWLQCSDGETCDDAVDNDFDGDIDCADADCVADVTSPCEAIEETCDDGLDNDADGTVDCEDPSCDGIASCELVESLCGDGFDNDADGATDCADASCTASPACLTSCADAIVSASCGYLGTSIQTTTNSFLTYPCATGTWPQSDVIVSFTPTETGVAKISMFTNNPNAILVLLADDCETGTCLGSWDVTPMHFYEAAEFPVVAGTTYFLVFDGNVSGATPGQPESLDQLEITCSSPEVCDDGVDNDLDGDIDCADADCAALPCEAVETLCDDGIDNDGDGDIDCADTGCAALEVMCENPETTCDDGFDNDADGATDCQDTSCIGQSFCEPNEITCDDDEDNDGDGLTDCGDPGCGGSVACDSSCETVSIVDVSCGFSGPGTPSASSALSVSACADEVTPGREMVFRFEPTEDATVTFLAQTTGDGGAVTSMHQGTCAVGTCVASTGALAQSGSVQASVVSGETYFFVVDRDDAGPWALSSATLNCLP